MRRFTILLSAAFLAIFANVALAGRIVVNHDEWTLSNVGFSNSPTTGTFVDNVAQFFTGGGTGTFHAYSTNFGLIESSLATAFASAGHTYSVGTGITFDLTGLQAFDGILVAGDATGLDTSVLVDYVNAGGSVYLAGGTGEFGGSVGEATFWNNFLNQFGMEFETFYNGFNSSFPVQPSPHPIFDDVETLFDFNGNSVLKLVALDPNVSIFFDGRYAVYDPVSTPAIPVPAAVWLFGTALIGLLGLGKRKKSD